MSLDKVCGKLMTEIPDGSATSTRALQFIVVVLPTLLVTGGLVWTHVVPTQVFGASHGFYDHYLVVKGWPIIYSRHVLSVPQSGVPIAQNSSVQPKSASDWLSPIALLSDVLLSGWIICSTIAVCTRSCRIVRAGQFTVTELLWCLLAASLATAIMVHVEYPPFSTEWFGANTDAPRLATLIWYPPWAQCSFGIGTVCGALVTCWILCKSVRRIVAW